MPYKVNDRLPVPEDENQIIWRYLEFPQLISIFERRALWFNRAIEFDDPLEGSWTRPDLEEAVEASKSFDWDVDDEELMRMIISSRDLYGDNIYVNCWHMNAVESSPMWSHYSMLESGVAIKSTVGGLIGALDECTDYDIHLSPIDYVNFEQDSVMEPYLPGRFLYKDKSHEAEQELRAIVNLNDVIEVDTEVAEREGTHIRQPDQDYQYYPCIEPYASKFEEPLPSGLPVEISLDDLIDKILIAPDAPGWTLDLVEEITETYDVSSAIVNKSSLKTGLLE